MPPEERLPEPFAAALGRLVPSLLAVLESLDGAFRRLHPPRFAELRNALADVAEPFAEAVQIFEDCSGPPEIDWFRAALGEACRALEAALDGFGARPTPSEADAGPSIGGVLEAMHRHARARAALYPLRFALPPVSLYFAEPFRHRDPAALEAPPGGASRGGLLRAGELGARGGFELYVPESWDGVERLPLIVALHGGSGQGADFLWTWLREARSRRCLLLAPSSRGPTWSLDAPDLDGAALRAMLDSIARRFAFDASRVLLTGLSDGATMTLLVGLAVDAPYTHLAPVSGVLHPHNFASGNVARAAGRPIRLVHGALDWMFPVSLAREAARALDEAGAELVYREVPDLSHTYPVEENAAILDWWGVRAQP